MEKRRKVLFLGIFMLSLLLSFNIWVIFCVAGQDQGTEYPWPMYLKDSQHTGYTESPAPRKYVSLWNYTAGGVIASSPAVAYGKVFFGCGDKKVYALNQSNGNVIWEFETGDVIWSSPAVADGSVFIGSFDGKVYALDQADGDIVWEFIRPSAVPRENAFYSSPVVADGMVFIGSINSYIYALDQSTGAQIWNFTTGGGVLSSPAVAYSKVFVGSNDGFLYALNMEGSEEWRSKVSDGAWWVLSSPAVADNKVFIGSAAYNKTYALAQSTGAEIWNFATEGRIFASPTVAYGKVFIGSQDKKVYALDLSTGNKIWEFRAGNAVGSPASIADEMVFIGSYDGKLYALHQSNGTKIWEFNAGGQTVSSPAVADGKIFATFNTTVYAFATLSILTISLSRTTTTVGSPITVEGSLSPIRSGATILIQQNQTGGTWSTLETVTTNETGHYTYSWTPDAAGTFGLKASWQGDAFVQPTESIIQTITVTAAPPLISMELLIIIVVIVAAIAAILVYLKKRPKKPKLRVSADPKEISADGKSTSTITIELIDAKGNPLPSKADTEVSLSSTAGKIASSVTMLKGKTSVTTKLTSSTTKETATITAQSDGLKKARIEVVFVEKQRFCMGCGARMLMKVRVCKKCGARPEEFSSPETKECGACGATIPFPALYCSECGAKQP